MACDWAQSSLQQEIVHQMMLSASCVIDGALLRVQRADQVRMLDQRQSAMSGRMRTMFNGIRSVAATDLRNGGDIGSRDVAPEMKGISELRRGRLLRLAGGVGSLIRVSSVLARSRMRVCGRADRRLVRLPLRLAGIGAARRLRVMPGMLRGSGRSVFRSV